MILIILGIMFIFGGVLTLGVGIIAWPVILVGVIAYLAYKAGAKKKGGDK